MLFKYGDRNSAGVDSGLRSPKAENKMKSYRIFFLRIFSNNNPVINHNGAKSSRIIPL